MSELRIPQRILIMHFRFLPLRIRVGLKRRILFRRIPPNRVHQIISQPAGDLLRAPEARMLLVGVIFGKIILHRGEFLRQVKVIVLQPVLVRILPQGHILSDSRLRIGRHSEHQTDPLFFTQFPDLVHVLQHGRFHLLRLHADVVRVQRRINVKGLEVRNIAVIAERGRKAHQIAVFLDLIHREIFLVQILPAVVIPENRQEIAIRVAFRFDLTERTDRLETIQRPVHVIERFLVGRIHEVHRDRFMEERIHGFQDYYLGLLIFERFLQPEVIQHQVLIAHAQVVTGQPVLIVQHLRQETRIRVTASQKQHIHRIVLEIIKALEGRHRRHPLTRVILGKQDLHDAADTQHGQQDKRCHLYHFLDPAHQKPP